VLSRAHMAPIVVRERLPFHRVKQTELEHRSQQSTDRRIKVLVRDKPLSDRLHTELSVWITAVRVATRPYTVLRVDGFIAHKARKACKAHAVTREQVKARQVREQVRASQVLHMHIAWI
jgi:hypothetical protein